MYISNLSLRNFRNFHSVRLEFKKGVNTIIGENGSGKSNLLHALRLLIDDSMPRSPHIYETDFSRKLPNWKGHWIIIQVQFSELDTSEEIQSIVMHKAGNVDTEEEDIEESDANSATKGSYCLLFRPREIIRRELYEYSLEEDKSKEGLDKILRTVTLNDYELTFRGRGNADFSDESTYKKYVGDFDRITFPDPDDHQLDAYGTRFQGLSISTELSCTFVKALRDVESDLKSYRDNPLLSLLRGKEQTIDTVKKQNITNTINDLNQSITSLKEVTEVSDGIANSLQQAIGQTYAPNIEIKSELPSEIEKLLQSLKLWVGDPDDEGYKGRIWELSLGGANMIYFSLKLLEYEKVKSLNKIGNFLLIEEPEAHIHTHIQKTLFQKLHARNTQIIITTHSTHISSVSQISSVNVLSRANKEAIAFSPSNGLSEPQLVALERYLDAVRTNLLFAKSVLLVEGDAEQILIPELVKRVFGVSLDELGISLVNIGSTGFENIAILFHDDRVQKRCAIITDLDTSVLVLPDDEAEDSVDQKACRSSQISGSQRETKLDAFCKGNSWVNSFYGKYTFEVDFMQANNVYEVKMTVEKVYKRKADKERIVEKLEKKNVSISGTEILRLANSFGKGWFAIMLAEEITHLTNIPKHILEALAFVTSHINTDTLLSIAKFRATSLDGQSFQNDKYDYQSLLSKMNKEADKTTALSLFEKELPKDQLTNLLSYKILY